MTNEPGLAGTSLVEFGQGGEYHSESMSLSKQTAGFAPLETLPAEWYNNYMALLDKHINQLQVLVQEMQTELSNIITWDNQASPSSATLTQVLSGITRKIDDMLPVIATGTTPGLVVSSAAASNVSVDTNGVMTYNGHDALIQEIADAKDALKEDIDEATQEMEDTISGRAHVIALNCTGSIASNTIGMLTATSRVDGGDLSAYTPQAGDIVICTIPAAVYSSSLTTVQLTINSVSRMYYITSGKFQLSAFQAFLIQNSTYMAPIGNVTPELIYTPAAAPTTKYVASLSASTYIYARYYYLSITITGSIYPGDRLYVRVSLNTSGSTADQASYIEGEWEYSSSGDWLPFNSTLHSFPYISTATSTASYMNASTNTYPTVGIGTVDNIPIIGVTGSSNLSFGGEARAEWLSTLGGSSASISIQRFTSTLAASSVENFMPAGSHSITYSKIGTAYRLNNSESSNTNLCYADASGNLYAHTLTLT